MAVTLSVADMLRELRIETTEADEAEFAALVTRHLATASAMVEVHAPDAPEAVQNQAAVQVAAYLFDRRTDADYTARANVFLNSGASAVLQRWRVPSGANTG